MLLCYQTQRFDARTVTFSDVLRWSQSVVDHAKHINYPMETVAFFDETGQNYSVSDQQATTTAWRQLMQYGRQHPKSETYLTACQPAICQLGITYLPHHQLQCNFYPDMFMWLQAITEIFYDRQHHIVGLRFDNDFWTQVGYFTHHRYGIITQKAINQTIEDLIQEIEDDVWELDETIPQTCLSI